MKNEKFEEALKRYKEKSGELRDRLVLVITAIVYIVGFLIALAAAVFNAEANAPNLLLIFGSIIVITMVGVVVGFIIAMLNDIKVNTWIAAHKDDYEDE